MSRGAWRLAAAVAFALLAAGCAKPPSEHAFDPDAVPSAYHRTGGGLAWPGATRGWRVDDAGDLSNGAWRVRLDAEIDGHPASMPLRVAALDRWRPLLRWTRHGEGAAWEMEAVAFPAPVPADTQLCLSLRVRAVNAGAVTHEARLRVTLDSLTANPIYVASDAPGTGAPHLAWGSHGARDTVCAWAPQAASGATLELQAKLPAHGERTFELLLPAYPTASATLQQLAREPHAQRVNETLERWDAMLADGASFDLGDPEVESALRAALVLLLSSRERHAGRWYATGGPFQYHDVWLRDGARLAQSLALAGHLDDARDLATALPALQWPNGALITQRGQLDGTGQALWTMEQVLLRDARRAPSDTVLAAGLRAWRWIEWERSPAARPAAPYARMMTFADPRDGELVRAQLTGNDAWSIAGERGLERMLRAAGRAAQADSVAASARDYRAAFVDALARCGAPDVPPSWQRVGRDWGNLAVGWPCAVLPPNDPHLMATAHRVWSHSADSGLASYGSPDSLHSYLGADLGTWALLAGRRSDADRVLASMLRWRDATGCAAEIFSAAGDYGRNLPPHPTAAAAMVALVRNAILYDEADTLRLTMGARDRWWHAGRVRRAPTWWGALDLLFTHRGDDVEWQWTSVPVPTVLTLPPGTRLAEPPAPPLVAYGADGVLAPAHTSVVRVRVTGAP
jgi:hypothetical protein